MSRTFRRTPGTSPTSHPAPRHARFRPRRDASSTSNRSAGPGPLSLGLLLLAAACGGEAAALTAPDTDGRYSAPVADVDMDRIPPSLDVGEKQRVEVHARDAFGRPLTHAEVSWSTSDSAVLRIERIPDAEMAAEIVGSRQGSATVIAMIAGESDSAAVSVDPPIGPGKRGRQRTPPGEPDDPDPSPPSSPPSSSPPGLVPAFPGAEGYGALALSECRAMRVAVHEVTTTAADGRGSFYDIVTNRLSKSRYDIVIFRRGGTITLRRPVKLDDDCIYIAGQTAPGGGVQIRGPNDPDHTVTPLRFDNHDAPRDVVIRYLRFRPGRGEPEKSDALAIPGGRNVVVDHVSTAFDNDKAIPLSPSKDAMGGQRIDRITLQWSLLTTSLAPHSTANPIGSDHDEPDVTDISVHHNAYIHNSHRNPLIKRVRCIEVVNNVVYDWSSRAGRSYDDSCIDYVGNYYRPGPWSDPSRILEHEIRTSGTTAAKYFSEDPLLFMRGNLAHHLPDVIQRSLIVYVGDKSGPLPASAFASSPSASPAVPVTSTSARAAYGDVLKLAGASARLTCDGDWTWNRDRLDERLVTDVLRGGGPAGTAEADHQSDYGGFPDLSRGTPCADSDRDGMPDDFESRYGLDEEDGADAVLDADGDGYLNIEEYLNGERPT